MRILAAAFAFSLPLAAVGTDVPPGDLPASATWTLAGSPYRLTGDVVVKTGAVLTIEAGVQVIAAAGDALAGGVDATRVELVVEGGLAVQGTPASPVVLDAESAAAGGWRGVRILSGASASIVSAVLDHAVVGLEVAGGAQISQTAIRNASSIGVDMVAGTARLDDLQVDLCPTGILIRPGAAPEVRRALVTGSGYRGVDIAGGGTLSHLTVAANQAGVYAAATCTATLRDSIVAQNAAAGVQRATGNALVADHNDVWGSATDGLTAGDFSANPLFVGGGSWRITSRSPARFASSTGDDLGALPYAGDPTPLLEGTLFTSTTLSGAQTLAGDLTVAPGVTLTIAPGSTITAAATDDMKASYATKVELIVRGTLVVQGTADAPVAFKPAGPSWGGIAVLDGAGTVIAGASIESATTGIRLDVTADVVDTQVRSASSVGIQVNKGLANLRGVAVSSCRTGIASAATGVVNLSRSVVSRSSFYAMDITGSVTVDHSTLADNTYGIRSGTAAPLTLRDSIVARTGSNTFYLSGSFTSDHNDVWPRQYLALDPASISADPLFVGAFDYHLHAASPCRGAASDGSDLGAYQYAPGPLAKVVVAPGTASVGAGGTASFTAAGYDTAGDPIPGTAFTWSASTAVGTISSTGQLTAGCTLGTFPQAVVATAGGISGSADVTVAPGPATQLTVAPAAATVAAGGSQTFTAPAADACGNPVNAAATWSATPGAGSIGASSGVFAAPCTPGAYPAAVTAAVGGLTASADVTVLTGPLARVAVSPARATVPVRGTQPFSASGADGCGNPVAIQPEWSVSPGAGGTVDASTGVFTAGTVASSAPAQVVASAVGIPGTAEVTVAAGDVATVEVMPASVTLPPEGSQKFSAVALDVYGNVASVPISWTAEPRAGTIDPSTGALVATTVAGSYLQSVTATAGGVTGKATVVVMPGPASVVQVTPSSATLAPGGTTTFAAQARDAFGNATADPILWSALPAAGSISQDGGMFQAGLVAGAYPAAVMAVGGGVTATADVTIAPGALARLVVEPSAATVRAGGTVALSASGRDAHGNSMPVAVTWTVVHGGGTVDGDGLFRAGTVAGTFDGTVQAAAQGISAVATVIVTSGPAASVTVSPASARLDAGSPQHFSAEAKDAFGNAANEPVTWVADPRAGAIDSSGRFTAGNVAGDYPGAVTAIVGTASGTADVSIWAPATSGSGGCGCGAGSAGGAVPAWAFLLAVPLLRRRRIRRG